MTDKALESQSHGQDANNVASSTTTQEPLIKRVSQPEIKFESTAELSEDFRSEFKKIYETRKAEKEAKKSSGKPDAGKQAGPKDRALLKGLEAKFKSEFGEDQSVGEEKEEVKEEPKTEESLSTESETVEDEEKKNDKEDDKLKKTGVQKKIDRLFARTKSAEEKSEKLYSEKIELEKKLEIFTKEYNHLLKMVKEDPRDVEIRRLQYEREMEDFKKTVADQLKTEKQKLLREFHQQQQEAKIIQETEALAEKYFTVSPEELLIRGNKDIKRPLEDIAKELHTARLKKAGALKAEETKVVPPKTTANVGTRANDVDFDLSPDGWRAYLRSKGRNI